MFCILFKTERRGRQSFGGEEWRGRVVEGGGWVGGEESRGEEKEWAAVCMGKAGDGHESWSRRRRRSQRERQASEVKDGKGVRWTLDVFTAAAASAAAAAAAAAATAAASAVAAAADAATAAASAAAAAAAVADEKPMKTS